MEKHLEYVSTVPTSEKLFPLYMRFCRFSAKREGQESGRFSSPLALIVLQVRPPYRGRPGAPQLIIADSAMAAWLAVR
jgi:hypothetical protein